MNIVPIVIIAKTKKYIRAFRRAMATNANNAIALTDHGINKSFVFNKLVRRGVIIKTNEDKYYLDERREHEVMKRKRAIVITVMAVILIAMLIIVFVYPHHITNLY